MGKQELIKSAVKVEPVFPIFSTTRTQVEDMRKKKKAMGKQELIKSVKVKPY